MKLRALLLLAAFAAACGDDDDDAKIDGPTGGEFDAAGAADAPTSTTDAALPDAPTSTSDAAAPDAATPDAGGQPDAAGGKLDAGSVAVSCDTCVDPEFCERKTGSCEATEGECLVRPDICTFIFDPVCGCDGVTYSNDCVRMSFGVSLLHVGECGDPASCDLAPADACCFDQEDCDAGFPGTRCVGAKCEAGSEGVCKEKHSLGMCWDDSDCGFGEVCDGASICPCGFACLVPDSEGTCITPKCDMVPPEFCCFDDEDCAAIDTARCYIQSCAEGTAGVCEVKPPSGECWTERDCAPGESCDGASVCPCGALCIIADHTGTCTSPF